MGKTQQKQQESTTLSAIPVMGGLDDSPRGRLLRAAAHLFRTQGYERTTVRDLAALVGIQSGSLFHHFRSKEDILEAVMEEVIRFNSARMVEALALATTTHDRLYQLLRCELQFVNGDTGEAMSVLVYEWRSLSPERQVRILKLREAYEQLWLDILATARAEGLLSGDPFIIRRLLSGATAWTSNWFKPDRKLDIDQLALMALQMVLGE